jgi:hypothetical protein
MSYDNSAGLGADTWRHVAFIEQRKSAGLGEGKKIRTCVRAVRFFRLAPRRIGLRLDLTLAIGRAWPGK